MTVEKKIHQTIDLEAFVCALVLAPIVVAVLFFWIAFIPAYAVYFGAVPYLVFGTPLLLWLATRIPARPTSYALWGLVSQAVFVLCMVIADGAGPFPNSKYEIRFLALFGVPFSVAWFMAFGWLYGFCYRPRSIHPGQSDQ